ncbi:MAG: delta-lactam-biosynthetic de-N-acetylase [Clostridiaceae bacterium]|nr:delta-lactam-biosynthetic de-N-acetylase [Clostridiaceae bacterium]
MKRKIVLIPFVLLIILAVIIYNFRPGAVRKPENKTLFELSFSDLDFDNEISALSETYSPASYIHQAANNSDVNRVRGWGIVRAKDNKTPQADPGAPELLKKYSGIYIADTDKPIIYLTFDEGYEAGYTAGILDCLKKHNVNAIFFITGPYLNKHEDLVRRMVEEGHAVGNHTVGHFSLPTLDDEKMKKEVAELDRVFYEKFKKHMVFLRPPRGEYSERSLKITSEMGYINVFWSFAYKDWDRNNQKGWEHAYNNVMPNLHNGAILLLHAVSSDNAQALERIITDTRKKGYEFGNVFDLIKIARGEGE